MQVGFCSWVFISLGCIKYQRQWRISSGVYVMKNSFSLDDSMSLDTVSGEWSVVGLLMMDCRYGVVCVYLCGYFGNIMGCGYRDNMPIGKYGWSLVRIT